MDSWTHSQVVEISSNIIEEGFFATCRRLFMVLSLDFCGIIACYGLKNVLKISVISSPQKVVIFIEGWF